jgi:hypothetical protein
VRRSYLDMTIAEVAAILGYVAYVTHLPEPVTIVLGLGLFAAPGYVWSDVLLSSRERGLERAAVAAGLSLIVPVLGGLGLYAAGIPLSRPAWVGLLSLVTLAGAATALITRRRRRDDPDLGQPEPKPRRRGSAWHVVAFGAAAIIAVAAVGLAVVSAQAQKYPGYTQLWLAPLPGQSASAALGVGNEQGGTTQYRLVLRRKGRVSATWNLTLVDGQSWQRTISYTTSVAMSADLYRLPDLRDPYRQVDNGTSPPRKPAATRSPHKSGRHS